MKRRYSTRETVRAHTPGETIFRRLPTLGLLKRFEAMAELLDSVQSLHLYTDARIEFDWNQIRLDDITLFTARNSRLALYVSRKPITFMAVPIAGVLTAAYEDRRVCVAAGRSVLISRYAPARLDLSEGFDCVYVKVRTATLRHWIAEAGHAHLRDAELGEAFSLDDARVAIWADFVKRLGRELDATGSLGALDRRLGLAAQFRELFVAGPVAALSERRARPTDPHLRTVRAAVAYMSENLQRKITLAELTEVCRVSERSIQAAFNKRFGYSPWTYLRIRRLEHARARLVDPHCRLSVAEIGVESGFNHLGQFAREYREHFGDTPKRTSYISRVTGNRWQATLQLAASSTKPIRRYFERLLAG